MTDERTAALGRMQRDRKAPCHCYISRSLEIPSLSVVALGRTSSSAACVRWCPPVGCRRSKCTKGTKQVASRVPVAWRAPHSSLRLGLGGFCRALGWHGHPAPLGTLAGHHYTTLASSSPRRVTG